MRRTEQRRGPFRVRERSALGERWGLAEGASFGEHEHREAVYDGRDCGPVHAFRRDAQRLGQQPATRRDVRCADPR
jgi:hypothetical protein